MPTFGRGEANRGLASGLSLREQAQKYRIPIVVPQPAEPLNREQRDLDHFMRCTRKGCTICAA